LRVEVYEGERALTKDNHQLGRFDLDGIPPMSKGMAKIDVTFELDENSILTVTAHEKGAGKKKTISITNVKGTLTPD
jgi:molecular chaperone DnaK (HSP70)